jgi:hypothetical protein
MTERDRESVGLTAEGQRILAEIDGHHWFGEGQDIARFAMAYAIRAGVTVGQVPGTETRWAVGNFDKTGEIRSVLAALYPDCSTPVRLMEHLVDEGLRLVEMRLRSGATGPDRLMEEP